MTSTVTGLPHQVEIYISTEENDNIISYETLKRMRYTHTNSGTKPPQLDTTHMKTQGTTNMSTKWITWRERRQKTDIKTKFILDSGSKINIMIEAEATSQNMRLDELQNAKPNFIGKNKQTGNK